MYQWTIVDENGVIEVVETFDYYVPSLSIRLYLPQSHFHLHPVSDNSFHLINRLVCLLAPGFKQRLNFPLNPLTNLAMMIILTKSRQAHYFSFPDTSFNLLSTCSPVADPVLPPAISLFVLQAVIGKESNPNLSCSQLELLGWYYHLGHVGMISLQRLMSPNKAIVRSDTKFHLISPCVIATK